MHSMHRMIARESPDALRRVVSAGALAGGLPQVSIRVDSRKMHRGARRWNLTISPTVSSEFTGLERLTSMKVSGVPIGLLIHFNVTKPKEGVQRFVL
jgi:hypothetical protein